VRPSRRAVAAPLRPVRRQRSCGSGASSNEASELQKATSEVLRVIASSTGDIERVFETILANAVRVCDAANGAINRWDGEILQLVATHKYAAGFCRSAQACAVPARRKIPRAAAC